ncbi:MAG: hypothetical protein ACOCV1_08140, partial [Bacillota bacterium]
MNNLMNEIPEMKEWKSQAENCKFLGIKISDLSREELLGVIGWFDNECKKIRKNYEQERNFDKELNDKLS